MKNPLAVQINPKQFALRNGHLEGVSALKEFPRLISLLGVDESLWEEPLNWFLDGCLNESKKALLTGKIAGYLPLICQRCLKGYKHEININFRLSPVEEKAASLLPEGYEPLLLEEEHILLSDLLTDEIILTLPLVARHPAGKCEEKVTTWEYGVQNQGILETSDEEDSSNNNSEKKDTYKPFAGLSEKIKKSK